MTRCYSLTTGTLAAAVLLSVTASPANEAEPPADAPQRVELDEGNLRVEIPQRWQRVKPRNRIIEVEIVVPGKPAPAAADANADAPATEPLPPGRLTIMSAFGSVDQNLARWIGQFEGTGAGAAREKGKVDHRELAGMPLHTLDISGTFLDAVRGPFGPKVRKPDHRMMAAILQTKDSGTYFFKLTGPADVVAFNAEGFEAMLQSVAVGPASAE